jgi:hypothetical protein
VGQGSPFKFLLFNIHQLLDLKLDPTSLLSGDNSHHCLHSKKIQCKRGEARFLRLVNENRGKVLKDITIELKSTRTP